VSFRHAFGALLVALLCACAVGPTYEPPELYVPDAWHRQLVAELTAGEPSLRAWWTLLGDPALERLIERASEGNLDLRTAVARVEEARAVRGIAAGERVPEADAIGSGERTRTSEDVLPAPLNRGTENLFSLGADSFWEVDFWGRVRRLVESADANLEASVEAYRDVLVVLYADVAQSYVEARALQARIGYTEQNIGTQSETLQLTRDRNRAGLVGDLDVRQAELNLASTEAFLPTLRQALAATIHRLGVLLGEPPSALYAELAATAPIPRPPERTAVGMPAELLRQRPDLRGAERELAAQTALIGVATADLYPTFGLSGFFTFDALESDDWLTAAKRSYAYGPVFRWALFDGGRVRNRIRVEDARTEQALAAYEQTLLRALEEVENALVAYGEEQERRDALERSVVAAEEATKLVDTLYRTGLTDFQNVLDTQRSLFEQQDDFAASEALVTQNWIRIYRALGGGWQP
jgi:NodT family efflux transporter outer membrane factor (OMF) lipoprotein